jgi:fructokinase
MNGRLFFWAITSALPGFLFGFDTVVISGAEQTLRMFDVNLRQAFYDADTIDASLRLASAVKLNDEELPIIAELCGIRGPMSRETLRELMVRYDLRLAALTRGSRGALLMEDRGEDECAAPSLTAVHTVGAGDAFTATLVSGFLRGLPLAEINVHANAVASFVCSQNGATPPLPDYLRSHP